VAAAAGIGAPPPARAADAPTPAQHKTTSSESYVVVEPIYASILDANKSQGLFLVEFGLDVPDAKLRDTVNRVLPMLRDAYVRNLLAYAATSVRPWRQPSVDDLATRLQKITDRTLGREGARVLMAQTAIRLNH
jgi:hypothetical protein